MYCCSVLFALTSTILMKRERFGAFCFKERIINFAFCLRTLYGTNFVPPTNRTPNSWVINLASEFCKRKTSSKKEGQNTMNEEVFEEKFYKKKFIYKFHWLSLRCSRTAKVYFRLNKSIKQLVRHPFFVGCCCKEQPDQ